MRVALGVAVFSGMLGVTIFGIFFTPVFYVVIRWFSGRTAAAPGPDAKQAVVAATVTIDDRLVAAHGVMMVGQAETPTATE